MSLSNYSWLATIGDKLPYLTLLLALYQYKKFKNYSFYRYFILYMLATVVVVFLTQYFYTTDNHTIFNVYTFFEFNSLVLIYYHLLKDKTRLKILKVLTFVFNLVYILSFYFDFYTIYTIPLEGVVNSCFVILYFIELLNSERVLNYKKLLPFWISVSFLIFYLTTVPFWCLFYSSLFETRDMFVILYYLSTLFQLIIIYGLLTCRKMEDIY